MYSFKERIWKAVNFPLSNSSLIPPCSSIQTHSLNPPTHKSNALPSQSETSSFLGSCPSGFCVEGPPSLNHHKPWRKLPTFSLYLFVSSPLQTITTHICILKVSPSNSGYFKVQALTKNGFFLPSLFWGTLPRNLPRLSMSNNPPRWIPWEGRKEITASGWIGVVNENIGQL